MTKPILLDTQLIVLLVVGLTSKAIIGKHKKLSEFSTDDFELLELLLGDDPKLVLLPNTVSEAGSLLRQHRNPERTAILSTFKKLIDLSRERYTASRVAASRAEYERLGITDSAIIACCTKRLRLLTADLDLYNAAREAGVDATNFNHERAYFRLI